MVVHNQSRLNLASLALHDTASANSDESLSRVTHPGPLPPPGLRHKVPTRRAPAIGPTGAVHDRGVRRLVRAVRAAVDSPHSQHVAELIPIATSAVRDAANRL